MNQVHLVGEVGYRNSVFLASYSVLQPACGRFDLGV